MVRLASPATGVCDELDLAEELDAGTTLLLDFAEELDAGAVPFPVTVMVPLFEAFVVAPVVVTVNLYAPGAAVAETVPEM